MPERLGDSKRPIAGGTASYEGYMENGCFQFGRMIGLPDLLRRGRRRYEASLIRLIIVEFFFSNFLFAAQILFGK